MVRGAGDRCRMTTRFWISFAGCNASDTSCHEGALRTPLRSLPPAVFQPQASGAGVRASGRRTNLFTRYYPSSAA
eukprot:898287-Pyramimonas_sp.AAC.1